MDKVKNAAANAIIDPTQIAGLIAKHKAELLSAISIIMIVVIIIALCTWFGSLMTRESRICNTMNKLYSSPDKVSQGKSLQSNLADVCENPQRIPTLGDFYIKTAYNCCSAGNYKNSFVSVCALKNCIRQGARCLDFEIYSVDNKPVIATSTQNSCKIKETYNSVPFSKAMSTIATMAFDTTVTPYANDPLLLHLRLKNCPENIEVYQGMADSFKSAFGEKHLLKPIFGREYWAKSPDDSSSFSHYNLGEVPVAQLMGKVIIMVDQIPSVVRACEAKNEPSSPPCHFYDFVNIAGGEGFLEVKRYSELKANPSAQDIVNQCKVKMCICLPDLSNHPKNINFGLCKSYGVQMAAMCFQNFDENMEMCDLFFNGLDGEGNSLTTNAGAFVIKPEILLAELNEPIQHAEQDPALSFSSNTLCSASLGKCADF